MLHDALYTIYLMLEQFAKDTRGNSEMLRPEPI